MAKATYLEYTDRGEIKRKEKCDFYLCTKEKPLVIDVCLPTEIKRNNYFKSVHIPIKILKRLLKKSEES